MGWRRRKKKRHRSSFDAADVGAGCLGAIFEFLADVVGSIFDGH